MTKKHTTTITNKLKRATRTRAKINRGKVAHPRLSVAKSNRHLYVQLIDDAAGKTLVGVGDIAVSQKGKTRMEIAFALGQEIAKRAKEQKITKAVFDRGPHRYHGIVKAIAEGARDGGLAV